MAKPADPNYIPVEPLEDDFDHWKNIYQDFLDTRRYENNYQDPKVEVCRVEASKKTTKPMANRHIDLMKMYHEVPQFMNPSANRWSELNQCLSKYRVPLFKITFIRESINALVGF